MEDIIYSWDHAFSNNLIPKESKRFILDYRQATFKVTLDEYTAIPEFYKNNLDRFENSKVAVLTVNPNDVVIPTLVETHDKGYTSKPFSTLEAAIGWVLN